MTLNYTQSVEGTFPPFSSLPDMTADEEKVEGLGISLGRNEGEVRSEYLSVFQPKTRFELFRFSINLFPVELPAEIIVRLSSTQIFHTTYSTRIQSAANYSVAFVASLNFCSKLWCCQKWRYLLPKTYNGSVHTTRTAVTPAAVPNMLTTPWLAYHSMM